MAVGLDAYYDFFMTTAFLVAQRSKSYEKVGACVVNEKHQIVGIGYNTDGLFHAELTAIAKSSELVKHCTLCVTLYPCNDCAKLIIQSGIKRVIYSQDKWPGENNKLLDQYGVQRICYIPQGILRRNMFINFRQHGTYPNFTNEEEMKEYPGISWNHLFMAFAYLIAEVHNSPVGACIVNKENQIVGIGYMTTPYEENSCMDDESQGWDENFHAEIVAMDTASQPLVNCTLYVSVFPCNRCSAHIVQSGIKKVIYNHDLLPNLSKNYNIEYIHYIPPFNVKLNMATRY